jgi:hypothetical protein
MHHAAHLAMTALTDHYAQISQDRVTAPRGDRQGLDLSGSGDAFLELHTRAQSFEIR